MEIHLLLDIEETIMVCSLASMATQIARMETGNGSWEEHRLKSTDVEKRLKQRCLVLHINDFYNDVIPLMNQRESRKRVEIKTEVTGTEIDAQGMIESEIETEVIETVRTIEAMIARGGAGSMIVIETGDTDTDLVQTLLEGRGIALDPSHHHDHDHATGEASGQVGLIWHPQVQQLFQVQCLASFEPYALTPQCAQGTFKALKGGQGSDGVGGSLPIFIHSSLTLCVLGQIPGMPQPMPGVFPGMFPFGGAQFGGLANMPAQAMTQQATRHARRVYVGGLPPVANEQTIATYFSQVMAAVGANTAGPGDAVVNVYINQEKKFAFVEMRTVEEASNAMALDGIIFEGVSVRVRRPSDYNPSMAATLGPSQPSPHLNLAAVGLTPGSAAGGADGPDRVFVGGLPYYLTEVQIKELLESFGPLRGFDLVKDRDTGNSKGYGFCVYQDPAVTDVAIAALNGLKMGDKTLSVRRASASSGQPKPDQANVLAQAQHHIAIQKLALQASGANAVALGGLGMMSGIPPGLMASMLPGMGNGLSNPLETTTKVVALTQVVSADELKEDEEYEEILEDMREECGKYGNLVELVIPRPSPTGEEGPGVGKVFVEYSDTAGAAKAKSSLHGRKFGGNAVVAVYYSEEAFANRDYGG